MTRQITNGDDIIDSRDVVARIEALASEHEALTDAVTDAREALDAATDESRDALIANLEAANAALNEWTSSDEQEELSSLRALADQGESCSDWHHGEALIRDRYFTEYAQELAEDIGAVDAHAAWPARHIDWEAAADALKADYSSIDFDGIDYWIRS